MDETRFASDATDNSVASFLSRPLKIAQWNWTTATRFDQTINPWALFIGNKRVVNRLATYKLFRGKMKIKVMVNGNSFFFGRVMMSYWPLNTFDSLTKNSVSDNDTVQFSQMPRIFLDPTTSQGGEMSLPFFWHNDYLNLIGSDKDKLGSLVFNELTSLTHCNGDASINSIVSIAVYAWMEDVELQAPTAASASYIIPQSTKPDSIGPYAKGSQMPDNRKKFDTNMNFMIPRGVCNMNVTDCPDSVNRMTFTSNQEVSLDPRILGLSSEDELNIRSIAARESYLTSFYWSVADVSGTLMQSYRVMPTLHNETTVSAAPPIPAHTAMLFPACCGAVLPFDFWNGTFKLRLQIVASAFHRGRLAVVYDPHESTPAREDNVQYTHIIDIASCRDVTFKVGPNQDRTMLTYLRPEPGNYIQGFDGTALSSASFGNGTISIYVINELTLPNPTASSPSSIGINVFISIDDLDVFVPGEQYTHYCIAPQSTGVVAAVPEDLVEESQPYNAEALSLDQELPVSSKRHLVYVGEEIKNFRTMLNRYYPWGAYWLPNSAVSSNTAYQQIDHRVFPAYRGNVTGAVHLAAAGSVATNYYQMTLLNYLTPAFQGWRGSIRYKMFPRGPHIPRGTTQVNFRSATGYQNIQRLPITGTTTENQAMRNIMFSGPFHSRQKGVIVTSNPVNSVVEYEIPWWTPMRFCPGKVQDWTSVTTSRDVPVHGATVCIDNPNNSANTVFDVHVAAGDDFSLYFFTGWPRMMFYLDAPAL